jgi:hypothetical protein
VPGTVFFLGDIFYDACANGIRSYYDVAAQVAPGTAGVPQSSAVPSGFGDESTIDEPLNVWRPILLQPGLDRLVDISPLLLRDPLALGAGGAVDDQLVRAGVADDRVGTL